MIKPKPNPTPHLLLDTKVLVDLQSFVSTIVAGDLGLIKRWDTLLEWEDAMMKEVKRIIEEHGEGAYTDSNALGNRLLECRTSSHHGSVQVLTAFARHSLRERIGPTGFLENKDLGEGSKAQYFVKRTKLPGGHAEVAFSWYGEAWPLSPEERNNQEAPPESKGIQDDALRARLAAMQDAGLIQRIAFMNASLQETNYVQISGAEFRESLGCAADPNWKHRVEAALRALINLSFQIKMVGRGEKGAAEGRFLASFQTMRTKDGERPDWTFFLEIPRQALGSISIFAREGKPIDGESRNRLLFDLGAKIPRDALSASRRFPIRTIIPYLERELALTSSQKKLFYWLHDNVTLNKDAKRGGGLPIYHNFPGAQDERIYGRDFCSALPQGGLFIGALGHFKLNTNPESGWTLKFILEMTDRVLPKGQRQRRREICSAGLADLRRLVADSPFDGIIVVDVGNGEPPMTLDSAMTRFAPEALIEMRLLPFYPADVWARLMEFKNCRSRERYARGEVPRPVEFTKDAAEAIANEAARKGEILFQAEDREVLLRHQLREVRRARNLTQEEVAKIFDVSQMTVSNWEAGADRADMEANRPRGKPIPPAVAPLLERWLLNGQAPTRAELQDAAGADTRKRGPHASADEQPFKTVNSGKS